MQGGWEIKIYETGSSFLITHGLSYIFCSLTFFALFFTFTCITLISNHIPFKIIIKKSFIGKSEAARTKFTMEALVSKLKCLKEKVVARNSSKSGELWECYYHNKIFDCHTVETMLGVVLNLVAITQQISIDEKYICWKK